jgi:hypothetical protein
MVSAANGPSGHYAPRPMSPNEIKAAQINQTVGKAIHTYRQAMRSTSGMKNAKAASPPEEKGFLSASWDRLTNIF